MCLYFDKILFYLQLKLLGSCLVFFSFLCLINFVQEFLSFFCVFWVFNLFFFYFGFVFDFFLGQTKIFRSVYDRTKFFGSTWSGQLSRVNLGKKIGLMILIPCLLCNVFVKGFLG